MKKLVPLILLCAALGSGAPAGASPFGAAAPAVPPGYGPGAYVPGEVIVKFRAGTADGERAGALRRHDARTLRALPVPRARLVGVPTGTDPRRAAAALERDPAVAWAEPNVYAHGGSVPNDALLAEQWGLRNTGQTVDGVAGTAGADIHAPEAWARTTGSQAVRVAVVDTGVNLAQPDLAPNIWRNPGESGGGRETNGVDDDGDGFVDDWRGWDFVQDDNVPSDNFGHGTHVAGIIGARGDNGIGVAGVAWNVSLIPVRVLNNLNVGTCADIASGFAYAARAGARVVNASIWGGPPCKVEEDAIAAAPDTLFVLIAGNAGIDADAQPTYPCSFTEANIVCVAATGSDDRLADFSNYGAQSVDLAAPGASIKSTYMQWDPLEVLFADDFETALGSRWVTGGSPNTWARTAQTASSGLISLADSPYGGYANNTDNFAELKQGLDLTGHEDCAIRANVQTSLASGDLLLGVSSGDGIHASETAAAAGFSSGFEQTYFDLAPLDGRATGRFLFELVSDAGGVADGVYVDDVAVVCAPPVTTYTGAPDEYEFDSGTSMAAPHVAGVAALVLSLDPDMPTADLKARLLDTADAVPALDGKVATGARLDAAAAVDLPPAVTTGPAADVGSDGATVTGTVNPRGGRTIVGALVGTTTDYELDPVSLAELPGGTSDQAIGGRVSGLSPGTTYHYRIIAGGPSGQAAAGPDRVFTTAPRGTTQGSAPGGAAGANGAAGAAGGRGRSVVDDALRAAARALRPPARRALLRRGSVVVTLHAPSGGTLSIVVGAAAKRGRSRRATIATGWSATSDPGRVRMKVRLTRAGRRILRGAPRMRATLSVRFAPESGPAVSRSTAVVLR